MTDVEVFQKHARRELTTKEAVGALLRSPRKRFWFAVILAFVAGCPNPQPPHQDAADGAIIGTPETACAAFARAGCRSGLDSHCTDVVAHVVDAGLTRIDLTCIANAQSQAAIIGCGASCE